MDKRCSLALNVLLFVAGILLCFVLLEAVLATGVFDQGDNPHPVWIPPKFREIDDAINAKNAAFAKNNRFGFNDVDRTPEKKPGVFRIAILGDSFIWGDGALYDVTWNHKLEKLLKQYSDTIEVLSWGHNGWSTRDQYDFLVAHALEFSIDYVIIGFVTNDPDLKDIPQKTFTFYKSRKLKPLRIIFPRGVHFLSDYAAGILYRFAKDFGYPAWEAKLYSDENLKKYTSVIDSVSTFCKSSQIPLLFVLTPTGYSDYCQSRFNLIIPILERGSIPYVNTIPAIKRELSGINPRHLWTNPANGHPGERLTSIIAREVYNYLLATVLPRQT
jgi:hypothetical protein